LLARAPAFTALAVLILALAIGANTAIFSVINAVLLRPLPYKDSDRIVYLSGTALGTGNFADWKQQSTSYELFATVLLDVVELTGDREPQWLRASKVSTEYFSVMKIGFSGETD
jgi:putative ABC transport system permease protein